MKSIDQDVVIVGAGPAGSALAIELAEFGLDVAMLNQTTLAQEKSCGDYLSPRGVRCLAQLGMSDFLSNGSTHPISASRLYLNQTLLFNSEKPADQSSISQGLTMARRELDVALARRASSSGAKLIENFRVTNFSKVNDRVLVRGVRHGKQVEISARLLIGADGAKSVVAQGAGLANTDSRYILESMQTYVSGLSPPYSLMFFDERFFPGFGWIHPLTDGRCNIGVTALQESVQRDGLKLSVFFEQFKQLIERLAESRGELIEIADPIHSSINTYGAAQKNYFDCGMLVGEAANFVNPLNGEGISFALESAKLAAKEIRRIFESGNFSIEKISRYEKSWRKHFDRDLGASDLAISLVRNKNLKPLWIGALKTISRVARNDKQYASTLAGVPLGAIPLSEVMTPEMLLRTAINLSKNLHNISFFEQHTDIKKIFADGKRYLNWQHELVQEILGEDQWTRDWIQEITHKQAAMLVNQLTVNRHG
ncbi:MAG: NAD(P)/FAD-dependent oxidoreductase [Pseudomonadota bacterium]